MASFNCNDDIMIDLDAILLKPFEHNVKYAFKGWKSLALLHSWDEIVYKDIKRVFKYKEFKKEYQYIIKNEKQLIKQMKKRVRAYHSSKAKLKKNIKSRSFRKKATKKYDKKPNNIKKVATKQILFHQQKISATPMHYEQQNHRFISYNYNYNHYQNGNECCYYPNMVEITENSPNSDENMSYISYVSYISAVNDNSSSISLSSVPDNAFL